MQLNSISRFATVLAAISLFSFSPAAAQEDKTSMNPMPFGFWLEQLWQEAKVRGVSDQILRDAFHDVELSERVLELDRKQPESTITFEEYLKKVVPQSRVDKARALYAENKELLDKIGAKYGVQPRFIVALWGIESSFGERMGDFEIPHALATLAYDGRRSEFFRKELLNSLQILQEGHVPASEMLGSWAGAMGQCQFMPSSFLRYAVDYDGDGHKDIWENKADVFASIAHYLASEGWDGNIGWRSEHGERLAVGKDGAGPFYNVSPNYKVILRWNRSRYFATAVGTLADKIGEGV